MIKLGILALLTTLAYIAAYLRPEYSAVSIAFGLAIICSVAAAAHASWKSSPLREIIYWWHAATAISLAGNIVISIAYVLTTKLSDPVLAQHRDFGPAASLGIMVFICAIVAKLR